MREHTDRMIEDMISEAKDSVDYHIGSLLRKMAHALQEEWDEYLLEALGVQGNMTQDKMLGMVRDMVADNTPVPPHMAITHLDHKELIRTLVHFEETHGENGWTDCQECGDCVQVRDPVFSAFSAHAGDLENLIEELRKDGFAIVRVNER